MAREAPAARAEDRRGAAQEALVALAHRMVAMVDTISPKTVALV